MHFWRAHIIHAIFIVAQPFHLYTYDTRSPLKLTIHALIWLFILNKISIPFFTSPVRYLPSPPKERFPLCHLHISGQTPTTLFENWINDVPNDGLLALWYPLYLGYELVPTRPDVLTDVLNTHSYDWQKQAAIRKVLTSIVGRGLVNVEDAEHKAMRRTVAPSFSGQIVRALCPLFYKKAIELAKFMPEYEEPSALLSRATLDVIGVSGIGKDFNTLHDPDSRLAKIYDTVMNPPSFFLLMDILFPRLLAPFFWWTAYGRTIEAQKELREEVGLLVREKQRDATNDDKDIIANIMRSGELSEEYLVSQAMTFLAAGHETTASSLSWSLLALSRHPQVQDRLRKECKAILSEHIDASTFDPDRAPYLTAVCNEILRLYPPAPGMSRVSARQTKLGDITVPSGIVLHLHPWSINRSRELWGADAAEFKPDRWLRKDEARNAHAFLTFLHGPRSCIGQSFARLEMKVFLAALVSRLEFEDLDPDRPIEAAGVALVKPKGGLRIRSKVPKS